MRIKLSLLAVLASTAISAEEIYQLPTITLSANSDPIEIERTGAQVEILTENEIANIRTQSLESVLNSLVGVSTTSAGPMGSNVAFSIRGTRPYESKVFIDGIDVSDPSLLQPFYNFGTLNMGTIGRIEVVKGSQSAIYGGNAVGGVIAITSRETSKAGLSGGSHLEYGSNNSLSSNFNLGYLDDQFDISVSNSYAKTDGFSAADENNGNTEADGFEGNRWSVRAAYNLTSNITLGVSGFIGNSEGDYDGSDWATGAIIDTNSQFENEELGGRVYARFENDIMEHELAYSRFDTERSYSEAFADYAYSGTRSNMSYTGRVDIIDQLSMNLRLEQTDETYSQSGDYGDQDEQAQTRSLALGANFQPIDALDFNLAVRYDDHEIFGDQTTYRLAAAYQVTDQITLRGSYGTGYRTPSLFEMNYGATEDLKPETSTSYDFGVEYRSEQATLGANYFNIETDDLIAYGGNWPDDFYANVDGVSTRSGFELYGDYEIANGFDVNFGYTRTETEDATGERLSKIPEQELTVGVNGELAGFTFGADAKMVSNILDRFGEEFDDYTLVNARIGYQIGGGEIYLRAENLTDENYQTTRGYGTSGRAWYAGYQLDF